MPTSMPSSTRIDHLVREPQLEGDLGVPGQEGGRQRRDVLAAEVDRRGHAQEAARLLGQLAHGGVGVLERLQARETALEIDPSGLGQADVAGGAIEQARPHARLQRGDMFGHRSAGKTQVAGRRREPRELRHAGEHPHALQAVHAHDGTLFPFRERSISKTTDSPALPSGPGCSEMNHIIDEALVAKARGAGPRDPGARGAGRAGTASLPAGARGAGQRRVDEDVPAADAGRARDRSPLRTCGWSRRSPASTAWPAGC